MKLFIALGLYTVDLRMDRRAAEGEFANEPTISEILEACEQYRVFIVGGED